MRTAPSGGTACRFHALRRWPRGASADFASELYGFGPEPHETRRAAHSRGLVDEIHVVVAGAASTGERGLARESMIVRSRDTSCDTKSSRLERFLRLAEGGRVAVVAGRGWVRCRRLVLHPSGRSVNLAAPGATGCEPPFNRRTSSAWCGRVTVQQVRRGWRCRAGRPTRPAAALTSSSRVARARLCARSSPACRHTESDGGIGAASGCGGVTPRARE